MRFRKSDTSQMRSHVSGLEANPDRMIFQPPTPQRQPTSCGTCRVHPSSPEPHSEHISGLFSTSGSLRWASRKHGLCMHTKTTASVLLGSDMKNTYVHSQANVHTHRHLHLSTYIYIYTYARTPRTTSEAAKKTRIPKTHNVCYDTLGLLTCCVPSLVHKS